MDSGDFDRSPPNYNMNQYGSPHVVTVAAPPAPPPVLHPENDRLAEMLASSRARYGEMAQQSNNFRNNLPAYTGRPSDAETEQSKAALVKDIQGTRANANARGLLYSGINDQNQSDAASGESTKLAKKIQGINSTALNQADQYDQLTLGAQKQMDDQSLQLDQLVAQQKETEYQHALDEQKSQSDYYSHLTQGAVGVGALALLMFGV